MQAETDQPGVCKTRQPFAWRQPLREAYLALQVVLTRPPKESAAALAAAKAAEALRDGADPAGLTGVGFLTKREVGLHEKCSII